MCCFFLLHFGLRSMHLMSFSLQSHCKHLSCIFQEYRFDCFLKTCEIWIHICVIIACFFTLFINITRVQCSCLELLVDIHQNVSITMNDVHKWRFPSFKIPSSLFLILHCLQQQKWRVKSKLCRYFHFSFKQIDLFNQNFPSIRSGFSDPLKQFKNL